MIRAFEPAGARSDIATAASIGAVAYLSADIAHHAFGHGLACLALGGDIRSLSSVFVDCTLTGAVIDLSGPAANLIVGLSAAILVTICGRRWRSLALFLILAAAFNLYWLTLQLVFSVATNSDDWAWPLHVYGIGAPTRWVLAIAAAVGYHLVTRFAGTQLAVPDRSDARRVVLSAWLAAGAVACLTAAFAKPAISVIVQHALPQALGLSIGLLFVPAMAARRMRGPGLIVPRSWPWILAAIASTALTMLVLGPGLKIAIH
jgi:hypothetical protein